MNPKVVKDWDTPFVDFKINLPFRRENNSGDNRECSKKFPEMVESYILLTIMTNKIIIIGLFGVVV